MNMNDFHDLCQRKEAIEVEVECIVEALKSTGAGITGSLVDAEGFPRSDIDVYTTRHQRHRYHCLQTDHTEVMKQIEVSMTQIYGQKQPRPLAPESRKAHAGTYINEDPPHHHQAQKSPRMLERRKPFAKIETVEGLSPAAEAGCAPGDLILAFGSVNQSNHRHLSALAELVQDHAHQRISVVVLRHQERLELDLIPNPDWPGRGALGCHIVPHTR